MTNPQPPAPPDPDPEPQPQPPAAADQAGPLTAEGAWPFIQKIIS